MRPLAYPVRALAEAARAAGQDASEVVGTYVLALLLHARSGAVLAGLTGCSESTAKRRLRALRAVLSVASLPAAEVPILTAGTDPGGSEMTPPGGSEMTPGGQGVTGNGHTLAPLPPPEGDPLRGSTGRAGGAEAPTARPRVPRPAYRAAAGWLHRENVPERTIRRMLAALGEAWIADGTRVRDPRAWAVGVVRDLHARDVLDGAATTLRRRAERPSDRVPCPSCGVLTGSGAVCLHRSCPSFMHKVVASVENGRSA